MVEVSAEISAGADNLDRAYHYYCEYQLRISLIVNAAFVPS
jgi:hypothetical protein